MTVRPMTDMEVRMFTQIEDLRAEVARLREEIECLRAKATDEYQRGYKQGVADQSVYGMPTTREGE